MNAAPFLDPYGYTLTDAGELVSPKGRQTGVVLTWKKDRYQARMIDSGRLLWSGADPGAFVARFWFAALLGDGVEVITIPPTSGTQNA